VRPAPSATSRAVRSGGIEVASGAGWILTHEFREDDAARIYLPVPYGCAGVVATGAMRFDIRHGAAIGTEQTIYVGSHEPAWVGPSATLILAQRNSGGSTSGTQVVMWGHL
jgi:hypothetical protein